MNCEYKGRSIDLKTFELGDGGLWSAEFWVAEQSEADIVDTQFFVKGTFSREEEALHAAALCARHVIDQKSEVQEVMEAQTHLPSATRRAFGSWTRDLAEGSDGVRIGVFGPKNPDDRFD